MYKVLIADKLSNEALAIFKENGTRNLKSSVEQELELIM